MIPQLIIFFSLFSVLRFIADWKPGHPLQYGFTESVVESAQKTTIFGVHLYDKLLFRTAGSPPLSLHVIIVIVITVALSATTTFMTVRQSAKRGLMQTGTVDPTNPAANMQKYMQYFVPFFSLTGLYWQYGLVLYWVTTNLWTLGQQYFMFRNWDPQPVGADGALGGATTGGAAKTAQNSARPSSSRPSSSRPSSSGQRPARPASGAPKTSGGARNGTAGASTASGRSAGQGSAPPRAKGGTTSASARTGTASRTATTASSAATSQNGTEKRGLLRLGRAKQEPEPQDDVPTAKVVRQQPVRQARSKRSGKR
jgi:YidC/Oxa1 family membrane protein insertase